MKVGQDDAKGKASQGLPKVPVTPSPSACPGHEEHGCWTPDLDDFVRDRYSTTLEDPRTGRRVRG
jgi:hypothetical protein